MVLNSLKKVTLIGVGNLGRNLLYQLIKSKIEIDQVISRSKSTADIIEKEFNVPATDCLEEIHRGSDLYILSIPDDEMSSVLASLKTEGKLLVHTSGSLAMNILSDASENFGVFYPLQSFSKEKMIDLSGIPVCLEANSKRNLELLAGLASKLSGKIYYLNSEQRQVAHVAAVFANNFVNNMYHAASDILHEHDIPFDILLPLIRETAEKVSHRHPAEVQTGPAVRNDQGIIGGHLAFLDKFPELKEVYARLTENIIRKVNKK